MPGRLVRSRGTKSRKTPVGYLTEFCYLPQRYVLQRASVVVTHGGLGTIKESVHAGIPIIVLPALFDQPFNAMRVRYHGLGEAIFEESLSADSLELALRRGIQGEYAESIARMQRIFREREMESPSHRYIRRVLNVGDPG